MLHFLSSRFRNVAHASRGGERSPRSKILIHGMNFFPECIGVGKYSGELAFSLATRGHSVEVVTAPPHYPGWSVMRPYSTWRYERETIKGVSVLRCPIVSRNGGRGIWRVLAPLSFAALAAPAVIWRILRSRPDVVVCIEPTLFSAPAALLAGRLVGARTVLHIQDLEVDAAFEVGHLKSPRARRAALRLERLAVRRFDLLVTISRKMRDALVGKGAPADRTLVLRNWVDLDTIRPLPADAPNSYREELRLTDGQFVMLYSGHMGKKQALDVVLEAARLCGNHDRLHFVIAGEGPKKAELVARYGDIPNVSFLPLQPTERFNDLLALANLHLLPQTKSAADLVLPSKLGAMLASGRPVMATIDPDTELGQLLQGVALSVPPEQPIALAEAIVAAAAADLQQFVQAGLRLAVHLSNKHILPNFEAALIGTKPTALATGDTIFDTAAAS